MARAYQRFCMLAFVTAVSAGIATTFVLFCFAEREQDFAL